MIAYADTGFLVSLYGRDDHSPTAAALVKARPVFLLTPLVEAEFTNALELRVFRNQWTAREARLVRDNFLAHAATGVFQREDLTPEIWEKALLLARRHSAKLGTRTLDVVHVATAAALHAEAIYTFDQRQRKLAKSVQLRILPA